MDFEQIITTCQQFVQIPGETGHERQAALFLQRVMEDMDFDDVRVDAAGNVIGTIHGNGPHTILLEGHLDTVGVADPGAWTRDPHSGAIEDGKLYGRGASDMRAALMTMTLAAAALRKEKAALQGNIVVTGVVAEEVFEGIAFGNVLDQIQPDLVILGEATELHLNIGQRGRAEIQVTTFGKSAHSANPQAGVNAVSHMMRLCQQIDALPLPHDDFLGPAILALTDIASEPYPGNSIIPGKCVVTYDRRLLPGETDASVLQPLEDLIQQFQAQDPTFQAAVRIVEAEAQSYTDTRIAGTRFFPAWRFPQDAPVVQAAQRALKQTGLPGTISRYSFCTDGSQSAGVRGIPTIGFGPSKETLAHVVDEYVEITQLQQAYTGYIALLREMLLEGGLTS